MYAEFRAGTVAVTIPRDAIDDWADSGEVAIQRRRDRCRF